MAIARILLTAFFVFRFFYVFIPKEFTAHFFCYYPNVTFNPVHCKNNPLNRISNATQNKHLLKVDLLLEQKITLLEKCYKDSLSDENYPYMMLINNCYKKVCFEFKALFQKMFLFFLL